MRAKRRKLLIHLHTYLLVNPESTDHLAHRVSRGEGPVSGADRAGRRNALRFAPAADSEIEALFLAV